jgi:uncharacterized membrane protein HdeD (DUF308 family)
MPAQTFTEEIKRHSNWSIFTGVLTVLLGLFLIAYPLLTATITTLLFGGLLIFVGVTHFFFALNSESVGGLLLKILLAAIYVIAGVGVAFFPITGVAALTLALGTLLLVAGAIEITMAFRLRPVSGWGWFLINAAASFLLGILILAGWPVSSVWAIGTLVGVSVLMNGISKIMIGTRMRTGVAIVEQEDFRKAA